MPNPAASVATHAEPKSESGADRRVDDRRPFRTQAVVIAPGAQEVLVRTLDISVSGLSIVAEVNPPTGIRFRIRIRIDRQPHGASTLETEVQVMHAVLASHESGFRIGLRFVSRSDELLVAIGNFMGR